MPLLTVLYCLISLILVLKIWELPWIIPYDFGPILVLLFHESVEAFSGLFLLDEEKDVIDAEVAEGTDIQIQAEATDEDYRLTKNALNFKSISIIANRKEIDCDDQHGNIIESLVDEDCFLLWSKLELDHRAYNAYRDHQDALQALRIVSKDNDGRHQ